MIKNLQFTAHLALYNVPFTENTWFIFKILADCVKYDLLPIGDFVDFGFTETPARNVRFERLGYESSNFVEVLGTIAIYIFVLSPLQWGISALA